MDKKPSESRVVDESKPAHGPPKEPSCPCRIGKKTRPPRGVEVREHEGGAYGPCKGQ